VARKVGRPAPAGCRAAALGHTAREHTAYGILDFAASASALLRIGVGIVASSPYVGLGVASGVGCGGVRRWRRCPAAAAVAAATAAARSLRQGAASAAATVAVGWRGATKQRTRCSGTALDTVVRARALRGAAGGAAAHQSVEHLSKSVQRAGLEEAVSSPRGAIGAKKLNTPLAGPRHARKR
jgi:hypothetical protein